MIIRPESREEPKAFGVKIRPFGKTVVSCIGGQISKDPGEGAVLNRGVFPGRYFAGLEALKIASFLKIRLFRNIYRDGGQHIGL
jgi:hypothetical protein